MNVTDRIRPEDDGSCSYDSCPEYDGKRCRIMGGRPHGCAPAFYELRDRLAASEERARRAEQALSEIRDAACGFDVSVGSVPETTAKAVCALARMVQEELATKARVRKVADHLGNLSDLKKRSVTTIREAYAHAQELVLNALLAPPPAAMTTATMANEE